MKTSKVVKEGQSQSQRAEIVARDRDVWAVEGRKGDLYRVRRLCLDRWNCDCQAGQRGLLCRHVTSVVKMLSEEAYMTKVAVWTSEEDARRQHRPVTKMAVTGERSFWLTHSWPAWLPRVKGSKIVRVKKGVPGRVDVYYHRCSNRFIWRQSCRIGG